MLQLLTTILLIITSPSLIAITANIDRNIIHKGESFNLIIGTSDQHEQLSAIDLKPLHNDFHVLNQSTSTEMNYVNGNSEYNKRLIITLMPKTTGKLTIPALKIANKSTDTLILQVESPVNASMANDSDIFIEINVKPESPYLDEQIIYSVKVFKANNSAVYELNLTEPQVSNANIVPLAKDVKYTKTRNNKSYQVIERRYAIFIHQSGNTEIISPILTGKQEDQNSKNRFDPLGVFDQRFFGASILASSTPFSISGDNVAIKVMPKPNNYPQGAAWLPAKKLILNSNISPDVKTINAGEPITRTLTMQAMGLDYSQLPEISLSNTNPNIKIYPNKAHGENTATTDAILGTTQQKIAYVGNNIANMTLPAYKLAWFNTKSHKVEYASLAAQTISLNNPVTIDPKNTNQTNVSTNTRQNNWFYITIGICIIGWFFTILYFINKTKQKIKPTPKTRSSKNEAFKRLQLACKSKNGDQILTLLLQYLRQESKNKINTINDAKKLFPDNKQWQGILSALEQQKYSKADICFDGVSLLTILPELTQKFRSKKQISKTHKLQNLFKISNSY